MDEVFVKTNGKARTDKKTYTKTQVTDPTFTSDYGRIVPPGYAVFDFDEQPYINIMYIPGRLLRGLRSIRTR